LHPFPGTATLPLFMGDEEKKSRRDFLQRASLLVAGGCGALAAVEVVVASLPPAAARRDYFSVGHLADFRHGTLTFLPQPEVFVLCDDRGLGAFSARCTHLGCTVRRSSQGFQCPCHGARYDEQGRLLAGPATRDLDWFALHIDADGGVWLDRRRRVPAGTMILPELPGVKQS